MSQMIIRIDSHSDDAEILHDDYSTSIFKSISLKELSKLLNKFVSTSKPLFEKPTMINQNTIAYNSDCIVINQPQHERIVLYDKKSYKIKFPNSIYFIYFVEDKITDIKAYSYKEYADINTALYKYPFPNMLSENKICIGSADRTIKNKSYLKALENIIYAAYTHDRLNTCIKGFTSTKIYFDYLVKNDFPYKQLINLKLKLKDLVII